MAPQVSINICCYNSEKYLEETLQSVCAQTCEDWELVVVNDGSTDSTEQIVGKYKAEGWPIVYHAQANAGLGRARNRALELSRGEYIAFIDHDDLWQPDKMDRQLALLRARPDVGVVYSNSYSIDASGRITGTCLQPHQFFRGDVFEDLLLVRFIPPWLTVVFRREALIAAGPFLPYRIVEDYDILLRLAARFPFDYVMDPLASYRSHLSQSSRHYDVMLAEQLSVYDSWAQKPEFHARDRAKLLARARGRSYFEAGRMAFYREDKKRKACGYLWRSFRFAPSIRSLLYLALSSSGIKCGPSFANWVRSMLWSRNPHLG